jgi:F-box/leucine-rich repeat protein 10/11
VKDIEITTHVPKKFRFPLFTKWVMKPLRAAVADCNLPRLCWYVGESCLRDLKAREELSPRVLESISSLADFLVTESRIIERGSEAAKKESKENVPGEKVKDAPALARELRWRARHALGNMSDDEGDRDHENRCGGIVPMPAAAFKNFAPKKWDKVVDEDVGQEVTKVRALRPDSLDEWITTWTDGWQDDEAGEAEVLKRRKVMFRVRKTESGIERQRIERTVEDWSWLGRQL